MSRSANRFEIRVAPEAEESLFRLSMAEREQLKNALEGVAEVSALAPPQYPQWFKRSGLATPLMRLTLADLTVSFELDCFAGSIRLVGIEALRGSRHPDSQRSRAQDRTAFL